MEKLKPRLILLAGILAVSMLGNLPKTIELNLCARADVPEALGDVKAMGATWIRVYGFHEAIKDPESDLNNTLWQANEMGLKMLVNVAPTRPLTMIENYQTYKTIIMAHPSLSAIELLNEPDDPTVERWRNRDLMSAAQAIKDASQVIWQTNPDMRIVVGAQVNSRRNLPLLLDHMQAQGLELNKFEYAIHVYQTQAEVESRIKEVRLILRKYGVVSPVWVTEIGANTPELQENLLPMVKLAFALNDPETVVCVHEAQPGTEWMVKPSVSRDLHNWAKEVRHPFLLSNYLYR